MKPAFPAACLGFSFLFLLGACASSRTLQEQYLEAREPLARRDFTGAAAVIEQHKRKTYKKKDRVLFYLDAGMLYHYAGEYEKSNVALEAAEQGIEALYTKSISKILASGGLNDNALDYAGEDYEDLYLNVFKGLNYMALGLYEDALVEVRKVQIKLNILEDRYRNAVAEYNASTEAEGELPIPESPFHNDVLARYLSCLLYRLEKSPDDMRIEYEKLLHAFEEQPSLYDFPPPYFSRELGEDEGVNLSIISFTGLSPVKKAKTFYLTTVENGVILNTAEEDESYVKNLTGFTILPIPGVPGEYHFKLEYPVMENLGSRVDHVVLKLGDEQYDLSLIEDMQGICHEVYRRKQPLVLGRTVMRIVLKGVVKEAGKAAVNDMTGQGPMSFLLGLIMDVAVDLTENADLRISRYFPAFAHAIDLRVLPGAYPLQIDYYGQGQLLFRDDRGIVNIEPRKANFFESCYLE